MHDSVKDMLRILKRCKTNKSLAVGNFHKKQPITPYNLKKYILLTQIWIRRKYSAILWHMDISINSLKILKFTCEETLNYLWINLYL